MTPEQRRKRARIAALSYHDPDRPGLADERRELRTERLMAHVRAVVDTAPPLSQAQRDRIAAALHPSTAVVIE